MGVFVAKKKKKDQVLGIALFASVIFLKCFLFILLGEMVFYSDCLLGLQKDNHSASNYTSCHPYDFLLRSPL